MQSNVNLHLNILLLLILVFSTSDGIKRIVDERYPLIFSYANLGKNNTFSHFGATVALSPGPSQQGKPSAWVFIGAPTGRVSDKSANPPTGVLWRCSIGLEQGASSGNEICKIIDIDPQPKASKSRGSGSPFYEERDNMWTGVSLAISGGRLVTCGHRHTRGGGTFQNGLCYFLQNTTTTSGLNKDESFSYLDKNGPTITEYFHRLLPFFVPDKESNNGKDQNFNFTERGDIQLGNEWAYGQVGTSLHIPKQRGENGEQELLLGSPGARMWSGAVVRYRDNINVKENSVGPNIRLNRDKKNNPAILSEFVVGHRGTKVQENGHWFELFGYAITSGTYFDTTTTLYAGGSPRGANLSGEVVIFDLSNNGSLNSEEIYKRQINPILTISPNSEDAFGSYFGSVLYSVDVDGDGRDELFIGAPYFSLQRTRAKRGADDAASFIKGEEWTGDNGCVFVYFFTPETKEINGSAHKIQSTDIPSSSGGARFGSAISHMQWTSAEPRDAGKLKTYIVIGSPYEDKGQGAVYIFHYVNFDFKLVQKILASVSSDDGAMTMKGFGSSISLSQDVDLNGTPDFAVGAYSSGQVVVFRTRPKAFIESNLTFMDKSRARNDGKISKTSTSLTLKSCITIYKDVGKIIDMEISVSLKLDKRFNVTKIYPWLTKGMNDYSYIYTEKLSMDKISSNKACREIEVRVTPPAKREKLKQYDVIQSVWYNATTSMGSSSSELMKHEKRILDYKIHESGNVTKHGQGKLQDFQPNLPNPIQKITKLFLAEFAPNDCSLIICNSSLHFETTWFLDVGKKRNLQPISEITLESTTEIIFQLNISNSNETAIKPTFVIQWPRKGIEVNRRSERIHASDIFLLQRYCTETHPLGSSDITYNCDFLEDITKLEPVVLNIPMSFKDFYATRSTEDFKIDFSIKPQDSSKWMYGNSFLTLNSDSKVVLVGSKAENVLRSSTTDQKSKEANNSNGEQVKAIKNLVSWKQSYWVRVEGRSSAKIKLQLAFPYKKIGVDSSNSPLIRIKGRSDNIYCTDERSGYQTNSFGVGGEHTDIDYVDRGGSEIGGFGRSSSSSQSQHEPMVLTREGNTIETPLLGFPKNSELLSQGALLIKCDNNEERRGSFSCLRVDCELNLLGASSVELGFELEMNKDDIDAMLSEADKMEVLIVSYGYATIFGDSRIVNDTSQTYFKPPFLTAVGSLVYGLAIIFGLLVLVVISYLLYKCGFFKRKEKEKLQLLKSEAETRKSVILPNFKPGAEEIVQKHL